MFTAVAKSMDAGMSKKRERRFAFLFEDKTISVKYVLNATDEGKKLTAPVSIFNGNMKYA